MPGITTPGVTPPGTVTPPDGTSAIPPTTAPDISEGGRLLARGENVVETPGGYLDGAIPMTQFRLRYDNAQNINRPDRAEFIYAAWKELSFHTHGVLKNGVFQNEILVPNALGPIQAPGQLNMQEISGYLEYAFSNRFSAFVDIPVRFLHFHGPQEGGDESDRNDNKVPGLHEQNEDNNPSNTPGGLSDLQFGFKYALLADPCQ